MRIVTLRLVAGLFALAFVATLIIADTSMMIWGVGAIAVGMGLYVLGRQTVLAGRKKGRGKRKTD